MERTQPLAKAYVDPYSPVHALETPRPETTDASLLAKKEPDTDEEPPWDADEVDPGVDFRHSGWQDRRRCVLDALTAMDGAVRRRERFFSCGSHAWVMQSVDDPAHFRLACNKCRDRFCSPCANDRARQVADCLSLYAKGKELRLLTLTLRQSDLSLRDDLNRLFRSFATLRRKKQWRESQRGGVYFCEIKRRRADDGWHTHLHVLTEGVWIDRKWLSKTWLEITGDSYVVHIVPCRTAEDAARYVAKYASKGVHGSCYHNPEILRDAMVAIRGRRLLSKFGTWNDLNLKQDVAAGEWLPIDSLSRLLLRSTAGDAFATKVLTCLRSVTCTERERSPPVDAGPSLFL